METAISTITQFDFSKEQIKNFVSRVVNEAINGNYDIFQIANNLKVMEVSIKEIKQGIDESVWNELDKYPEKIIDGENYKISKRIRANFDYSDDVQWKRLKGLIKERENMLKNLKNPVADTDTGEIINPAKVKHTEYYTIE